MHVSAAGPALTLALKEDGHASDSGIYSIIPRRDSPVIGECDRDRLPAQKRSDPPLGETELIVENKAKNGRRSQEVSRRNFSLSNLKRGTQRLMEGPEFKRQPAL